MQIPKQLQKLYVYIISRLIWTTEKYLFYPKLERFYASLAEKTSSTLNAKNEKVVIFDVGANKGQSIRFFKLLFPSAEIHAFEPSPKTYEKLQQQIAKHRYSSTHAYPIGLSETKSTLAFYESILDETSSFNLPNPNSKYLKTKNRILFNSHTETTQPIYIGVDTLENIARNLRLSAISILKIDAEGHE